MTIKSKLAFSYILMIVLVGIVGLTLIASSRVLQDYFEQRLDKEVESHFAKELQSAIEAQLQSANLYLALGESEDERRFNEQHQLISNRLDAGKEQNQDQQFLKLKNLHAKVIGQTLQAISLYKHDMKQEAFNIIDAVYMNNVKELKGLLNDFTNTKDALADAERQKTAAIMHKEMIISVTVLIIAVVMGIVLLFGIFQSIAKPLAILRKSALEIGAGNLESAPSVSSDDEFGQLARAFKDMAENLKKMQSQITQMDRMSSVGQLAGGVAHELNNPLTGVLGQSQILLERVPQGDPNRVNIEKIERAALRCRKIVRGLLDFSRQKDYQFQPHNMTELIEETLVLCETELSASKVAIIKDFESNITAIACSGPHLEQVFLNLITNALQAMPQGGRLTIKTRIKNNDLLISFEDTGIGIKPEHLTRVFDPFFTTKEIGKGTGLGLTVSFGIIQNHGGAIIVASAGERKGATFTIRLPLRQDKSKKD